MAFWIFKCSPENYRLADRLVDPNSTITWQVNQHQFLNEIRPGDTVFIWETGRERGIRAIMRLDEGPRDMAEIETELPYDIKPDTETKWRVLGSLTHRNLNLSHVALREEPGLQNLAVFRRDVVQTATNFPVTPEEGTILLRLVGENEDSFSAEEADHTEPNSGEAYSPGGIDRRPQVERQIRERRGSRQFRDAMRSRYGDRCLVTGCEVLAVLEAAHISPYRGAGDNHSENGLLLRSDIHTMFDLDLLGVEPKQLRVELHPTVAQEYGRFAGITLGCTESHRPSRQALEQRYARFRQRLLPAGMRPKTVIPPA